MTATVKKRRLDPNNSLIEIPMKDYEDKIIHGFEPGEG